MPALSGKIAFDGINEAYHTVSDSILKTRSPFNVKRTLGRRLRSKLSILIFGIDLSLKKPLHHFRTVVSRIFTKEFSRGFRMRTAILAERKVREESRIA